LQQFSAYSPDSVDFEDEDAWQEALEEHESVLSEIAKSDLLFDEVSRAAERGVQFAQETLERIQALRKSVEVQQPH
jgi:exonuclease VII small subunit